MGAFLGPETPPPPGGITLPPLPPPAPGAPASDGGAGQINASLAGAVQYSGDLSAWTQNWTAALFGGLQRALGSVFSRLLALWDWLRRTWLGHIIGGIYDKLKKVFLAIQREVKLLICIFDAYEALVQHYEQEIFGPLINLLQRLRRVLVVFRVFHLRWAVAVDQYLAGLEARLYKIFTLYQRQLNRLVDYLNLIVDPLGLFNESMYVKSAMRSGGALWDILTKHVDTAPRDLAPMVQTPPWANYNFSTAAAYANSTWKNGPQDESADQVKQADALFSALGAPPMRH